MKNSIKMLLLFSLSNTCVAGDLGKTTYQIACQNCHSPKLAQAVKAPAAFDKKAWEQRFDLAKAQSVLDSKRFKTAMDYLVYRVKIGKGLMYHYGLCKEANVPNKDCSDDALREAIQYMSQR